jgi:hypothetical protein
MQKHTRWGLCVVAAIAAGCAATQANVEPPQERVEATTGSNIPRRVRPAEAPAPRDPVAPSSGTAR